jgi:hypothetical protein
MQNPISATGRDPRATFSLSWNRLRELVIDTQQHKQAKYSGQSAVGANLPRRAG